ncbi:MAG: DUF3137 domain-containing protein [Bacteroidota bacterium]
MAESRNIYEAYQREQEAQARRLQQMELQRERQAAEQSREQARIRREAELRVYYNSHIRPELQRTERARRNLLIRVILSGVVITLLVSLLLFLKLSFLMVVLLPLGIGYMVYLAYRFERFRQRFKPAIVQLLLDFLNQQPNFQSLQYDAKRSIDKEVLKGSGLFFTRRALFEGEDHIEGQIGEMPFQLCEVYVKEESRASHRFETLFAGIFVHAHFNEKVIGKLAVWPTRKANLMHRSLRAYYAQGGRPVKNTLKDNNFTESFANHFTVYAHEGTIVQELLTPSMQQAMVKYANVLGERDVYFAINNQELFAAISHEYDLLEPSFFQTNVSFELIRTFYDDIESVLEVVQAFDQTR